MTITIPQLSGAFEYPVKTVGYLIKNFWDATKTGGTTPVFRIPESSSTQDPWYSGQPPEIVFRHNRRNTATSKTIGDTMFECEMDIAIHIFAITQQQEFLFQQEVKRILQENRRNPILKYSEIPAVNSGLKIIFPPAPDFIPEDKMETFGDVSETHSRGVVTARWYEFRS